MEILVKTTIPEKTRALEILEKTQALAIQMKEIQEILTLTKVKVLPDFSKSRVINFWFKQNHNLKLYFRTRSRTMPTL